MGASKMLECHWYTGKSWWKVYEMHHFIIVIFWLLCHDVAKKCLQHIMIWNCPGFFFFLMIFYIFLLHSNFKKCIYKG